MRLVLGALLIAVVSWLATLGASGAAPAWRECAVRYASARTARDTADVDGTYPRTAAEGAGGRRPATTCGHRRQSARR